LDMSDTEIAKVENQNLQVVAPIQTLNLGLHEIKATGADFIATRKLTSDIDTILTG